MAIVSTDGTVTPIYDRESAVSLEYYSSAGITNAVAAAERSNTADDAEQPANSTTYYVGDQIGPERMLLAAGGWPLSADTYYPYGTEATPSSGANHYKFTGKERDAESGNDYFNARYYGSSMGRFLSPDPMGGHLENPQTLNKYAYVVNNPLRYTDPTGLDIWLQGCGNKNTSTCQNNYVGTTDKNGNFTRTHLTGDQTKDATLGPHGISVTQDGKTYNGVWDTNKGENGTVTVAGVGALKGYNADVNGNCGGTCVASGEIKSADPHAGNITQALFGVLGASPASAHVVLNFSEHHFCCPGTEAQWKDKIHIADCLEGPLRVQ